jgi:hypothetical protein
VTGNLRLFAGYGLGGSPILGVGVIGFAVGFVCTALLALIIRQAPHPWLAAPVVLVAGYLGGWFASMTAIVALHVYWVTPLSWLVAAVVLIVPLVWLGAWTSSSRSSPAVVPAAGLAGATVMSVWLPFSATTYGFALRPGGPTASGTDIGWYAHLAAWVGGGAAPAAWFVQHPLLLPAVTVLWLGPVLVRPVPIGRALWPAVIGTAVFAGVAAVLPFAAVRVLPAAVRHYPASGASGDGFYLVLDNLTSWCGVVTVAVVAGAVVLRGGPLRPAMALLAATVTALTGTVVVFWVSLPIQCAINVWDLQPPPSDCATLFRPDLLATQVHWLLAYGLIFAVPLTAAAALHPSSRTVAPATGGRRLTLAVVVVVVAAVAWMTWAMLPAAADVWLRAG